MKFSDIKTICATKPASPPDIIGRIASKSRIMHYGERSKNHKHPFFMEVVLSDSTGSVKCVIWNDLALKYFPILQLNEVVVFSGCKMKIVNDEVELTANPVNPVSVIYKMTGTCTCTCASDAHDMLRWRWWKCVISTDFVVCLCVLSRAELESNLVARLPMVRFNLHSIAHIKFVPENEMVDVLGLLTYVGRVYREWSGPRKRYYEYRWIMLCDESIEQSFAIKLFQNSNDSIFHCLEQLVGELVLVTALQIHTHNHAADMTGSAFAGSGGGATAAATLAVASSVSMDRGVYAHTSNSSSLSDARTIEAIGSDHPIIANRVRLFSAFVRSIHRTATDMIIMRVWRRVV